MADKTIKTKIVLDGEKEFKQGLADSARALKVTESEMKAAASAYGVTGDRASYLAERQKLLKQALAQQEGTVNTLKGRVDEYANALGTANAGTQSWTIRLNNAQTKANNYRAELEKVEKEMTELGRDSVQVGRKLEQGIGEGAAEAADDVQTLLDSLKNDLSTIQFGSLTSGVKNVWDMASGAFSAIDGFVSGTIDYRRQLSFLEQNVATYGYDFESAKELMYEVSALTGDTTGAMETVSTLLATTGTTDLDKLYELWEGIAGATIKYQGIMTSQGMAEAIQETLATGSAVGQLAEYLEREGYDVEEFNKALEESKTYSGDLNIVLGYLAAGGLNDVYTSWSDANDSFKAARESEAAWADELAKSAGYLEKWVVTPVRDAATKILKEVNDSLAEVEALYEQYKDDTTGATQPGVGVTVSGFVDPAVDDPANYRKVVGDAKATGEAAGAAYAEGFDDGLDRTFDFDAAEDGGEASWIDPVVDAAVSNWQLFGYPINTTKPDVQAATVKSMEEILAELDAWQQELEDAGEEGGEAAVDGFETGMAGADDAAYKTGQDMATQMAAGMLSKVAYIGYAGQQLANAASGGASGGAGSGGGGAVINVGLNVDGREFAKATASYIGQELART